MDKLPKIDAPAWLIESMACSRADAAGGRVGTSQDVLREIFEAIDELKAGEGSPMQPLGKTTGPAFASLRFKRTTSSNLRGPPHVDRK